MLIRMFRSPMDPVRELRWRPSPGTSVRDLLRELEWPLSEPRTRVAAKGVLIPRDDWDSSVDALDELLLVGVPDAETLAAVGAFFAALGEAAGGAIVAGAAAVPGATAVGGFVGGSLGLGAFGTGVATVAAAGAITAGLGAIAGSFVQTPDQDLGSSSGKSSPTQAGNGNQIRRGDPIPFPVGTIGFQPPQGAIPYSYVQGNETVVVYLFLVSKGLVNFTAADVKIGEAALSEYPRVEVAIRNGDDGTDPPLTLFTNRVLQVSLNQSFDPIPFDDEDLTSPWTVVAVPGSTNTELGVDVDVPQGVGRIGTDGNNLGYAWAMDIEYRDADVAGAWSNAASEASFQGARGPDQVKTLDGQTYVEFRGSHRRPFKRGYRWSVPEGRYQIRMRRREVIARRALQRSTIRFSPVIWYAAKGFDYLNPVLEEPDVATIELRAPLDENFQGIQNNLLVTVSRPVRIYDPMAGDADADGWTASKHESSNGAAVLREILQGPANRRSVPDSQIDVAAFSAFYSYCETFNDGGAGGLTFDAPFDGFAGIVETCRIVAAGCRAQFTRDSTGRWTVIPDAPQPATPRAAINAANSGRYRMELTFPRKIHGVRAQFTDAATGYDSAAEMIVYDDGFSADGSGGTQIGTDLVTVRYDGATRPELVNALARYFLVNRRLRRYVHEVEMDPEHIHLPVGSLVSFSHPGALKGKSWGRIESVSSAVFRDVLDTNSAHYATRSVDDAVATYGDHSGPLLRGKGAARLVSTSSAVVALSEGFGTGLRNWSGLTVDAGVQPLDGGSLSSGDGVRIRLFGPTTMDWAEWNFGTSDGLSTSAMTRVAVLLGTDAPDASSGTFDATQVVLMQVRTNVVNAAGGRTWRVNDVRAIAAAGTVREVELDQLVEFAAGQSYAIEVRRVTAVQIDTRVDQYATRTPAEYGFASDRLVRYVYLQAPITVDGDSIDAGDLFHYGNPSTISERAIVKEKIAGANLTARVRLSPEAPGIHSAVGVTPTFAPLSSYDAPLSTLGPAKPTIREVITDERALLRGSGGVLRTRAILSVFTPEAIGRPAPAYYSVKYRKTNPTASPAVSVPLVQASTGQVVVEDVEDGFEYEFVVQGVDRDFRTSPPATATATVIGKTTPPPDVLGFRIEGGVNLRWTLGGAAPNDLAGYEIRKGPVGGTFDEARVISGPSLIASSPYDITEIIDQPGNAALYIVAVDTNGNRSVNPGVITGFIGVVPPQNVVTTADFHASGFSNLVDQVDSVLDGFESLIGKETPDDNLLIPDFAGDPSFQNDVALIEGAGTLQPSTAVSSVLDTERTTVNSELQAVRATDDTGNGCVVSLEYIEPKNGVDSEWSAQFYGNKSGSWNVTVRFIDANDPDRWSQYDFSSVAGLAYADLAIAAFPGTADSTGSSGAVNPAAVSRIEIIGVHTSQATNDVMILDDVQWEGGAVNGVEVEGGSGDLIQRASTVFYSSSPGSLFYDATPSSLFYDQETYLAGVYEFEYTPPTADVPVDLRIALTEDNGAAFTIQYKLATEDTYLDFPGVLRDVTDVAYDFRVLIESGLVRARFSKFQIELDVPDESETIEDFTVASTGTVRLPITKSYREIRNLFFTVQDDGNGGDSVRVLDYDETNGPSIVVTSAGTRVEGVIDAHVIGVKGN